MSDTDTTATDVPVKKPKPGTFSASYQPKHRRTADRIPHNVKADVVAGLAAHGEDGEGKGGFRGYITHLARKHPKQAARLVERLLPPSVVVANTGSSAAIHTVNIVSVESGRFLSPEEMQRAQSGSPLLLEHEPQPVQLEQLDAPTRDDEPAAITNEAEAQTPAETRLLTELNASIQLLAKSVGVDLDDQ